jgi:hypothetical protein
MLSLPSYSTAICSMTIVRPPMIRGTVQTTSIVRHVLYVERLHPTAPLDGKPHLRSRTRGNPELPTRATRLAGPTKHYSFVPTHNTQTKKVYPTKLPTPEKSRTSISTRQPDDGFSPAWTRNIKGSRKIPLKYHPSMISSQHRQTSLFVSASNSKACPKRP